MGKETNIAWTDSTMNFWWGCQKVGPGCDHCYAEAVDKRGGGAHWGPGVERRRTSEKNWNDAYRWNRNAEKFFAENGRRQRVFASSMSDMFDNAVPIEWARDAFQVMEVCNRLEWQPLTKRVGMVEKRIPDHWKDGGWPQHIGLMITCVNQEEFLRDSGKLIRLKHDLNIPWVGISYEPAQGAIDIGYPVEFYPDGPKMCCSGFECGCYGKPTDPPVCWGIDWIIAGGESGAGWRPADIAWFRSLRDQCAEYNVKFFMKQLSGFRPKEEDIPEDLLIREFPR